MPRYPTVLSHSRSSKTRAFHLWLTHPLLSHPRFDEALANQLLFNFISHSFTFRSKISSHLGKLCVIRYLGIQHHIQCFLSWSRSWLRRIENVNRIRISKYRNHRTRLELLTSLLIEELSRSTPKI